MVTIPMVRLSRWQSKPLRYRDQAFRTGSAPLAKPTRGSSAYSGRPCRIQRPTSNRRRWLAKDSSRPPQRNVVEQWGGNNFHAGIRCAGAHRNVQRIAGRLWRCGAGAGSAFGAGCCHDQVGSCNACWIHHDGVELVKIRLPVFGSSCRMKSIMAAWIAVQSVSGLERSFR